MRIRGRSWADGKACGHGRTGKHHLCVNPAAPQECVENARFLKWLADQIL